MATPPDGPIPLEIGSVDLVQRTLTRSSGETARLPPTETALLTHLVAHAGSTVPRGDLLRDV